MPDVLLFAEDSGHSAFLGALIRRVGHEFGTDLRVRPLSVVGGRPRLVEQLRQFVTDLESGRAGTGDLIVVATDANCQGRNHWLNLIREIAQPVTQRNPNCLIEAVPDPHVERWMLIDSHAFRVVFGRGCTAPDHKCAKDRYKRLLLEQIEAAGVDPQLGGMEFAPQIVDALDLDRALTADASLGATIQLLRNRVRNL